MLISSARRGRRGNIVSEIFSRSNRVRFIRSDHIDDGDRFTVGLRGRKHCFSAASAACGTSARGVLGGKRDIRVSPDARSPRRLLFRLLVWAAN